MLKSTNTLNLLLAACLTLSTITAHAGEVETTPPFAGLDDFIDEMVRKHGFAGGDLQRLFAGVNRRDDVLEAISRPAEAKPWYQYRPIFLTGSRIQDGIEFLSRHGEILRRAERHYGVPAEIITAILGVETRYGRYEGRYPVLESLATLGFGYPKRARFFRGELAEFLLLCREEGFEPKLLKGSYAGAMGLPQFIASSYRAYAVDFDGDGVRDLLNNTADAIGSIAAYLQRHGWQRGERVVLRAGSVADTRADIFDVGLKPHVSLSQLGEHGIQVPADGTGDELCAPLRFETEAGFEVWLGLRNFYAITRYNHSPLYALAVFQLAQAIRDGVTDAGT